MTFAAVALRRHADFHAAEHLSRASRRVRIDTYARRKAQRLLKRFFQDATKSASSYRVLPVFLTTGQSMKLQRMFLQKEFPLNVTLGGNLLPLKAYNPETQEKGVLLLTFNILFRAFHSVFDSDKLRPFYWMVLEPSDDRLEDPAYLLFNGWDMVLQAGNPRIESMAGALSFNVPSVKLSSSDWVDSDIFHPLPGREKQYDLIYIANWSRNKRHSLLFSALTKLPTPLKVVLVGFHWERSRAQIEEEMAKYGVGSQCEIFENLPPEEVNRFLNLSRVNLLLSRREGGNRALYEAMFAGIPSIVSRTCQGVDSSAINRQTGVLADDDALDQAILSMLASTGRFAPRQWALQNSGYSRSTNVLNQCLKELNLALGQPWSSDIVPKVNRPNLCYKFSTDEEAFQPTLQHLARFLRPESKS